MNTPATPAPTKRTRIHTELDKAQSEFDVLSDDLESAIARPKRLTWYLRISGVRDGLGKPPDSSIATECTTASARR